MQKILLADDDSSCRQALAGFLNENGYEVVTVADGDSACAELSENQYDLFIAEFHIQGKPCSSIVTELKERGIDIRLIIMTGDTSKSTEFGARRLSPLFFFVKPINLPDLKAVIDRALEMDSSKQGTQTT
ncbi:MAG: response regulator [Chitinivibrionales bacterium]|nr:response regulator [Chitinivibrionales bacterium]